MLITLKAHVVRLLHPLVRTLAASPFIRRQGQRLLAPFPRLKGWVIRQIQAGKYTNIQGVHYIEGYGERQQRLSDELNRRWQPDTGTHE